VIDIAARPEVYYQRGQSGRFIGRSGYRGAAEKGISYPLHPLHPDQPDNYNRRGYTDIAMKLFGVYAPTKVDLDIQKKEAPIVITPEIIERLERYERQRAELERMKQENPDLIKSIHPDD